MKNTYTLITCKLAILSEMHSFTMLQSKREGAAHIPTPKSATAKDTTNTLVLVRTLTFTVDEEDDKSIYNHREDTEKPAETFMILERSVRRLLHRV